MKAVIPPHQVIRSQRKTIALIVQPDGRLLVRAPLRATRQQIDAVIVKHQEWIQARQEQMRTLQPVTHAFQPGETFPYLGQAYPLVIVPAAKPALTLAGGQFRLSRSELPQAREAFVAWYREHARQLLTERVSLWARQGGFSWQRLRVSSARTRWGSCSTRGTLSFPWRLVMAPLEMIDYVVVHELAHTQVPNHSAAFWAVVARMMPDYAVRRKWFNDHGRELNL